MRTSYKVIKKIRKSGTSLAVNIPVEIVELMGLKDGEIIELQLSKIEK
jgi:antitoxin component of MazEF toxin-antitoxin module